jgi:ubiquinone biosynthesis protein
MFPQFPRLLHHALSENRAQAVDEKISEILIEQRRQSRLLATLAVFLAVLLLWQLW